ncbi:hypothetical protein ACP26F_17460 [Franconibacter pulveris 1160]|uniref:hypothetical protein n=1 Tax=Franconibacter pulveris TaxID=435910 RepID=UPI0012693F83|nr:hypothetical protein [Franconibacter pulveris]
MKLTKAITLVIALATSACAISGKPVNYVMDYPVEASRMSLGGEVTALIDCDTKEVSVISDSSNGIFSRHLNRRAWNICFRKQGQFKVTYRFDPVRGVGQNMLATQPSRTPV